MGEVNEKVGEGGKWKGMKIERLRTREHCVMMWNGRERMEAWGNEEGEGDLRGGHNGIQMRMTA